MKWVAISPLEGHFQLPVVKWKVCSLKESEGEIVQIYYFSDVLYQTLPLGLF